MKKYLYLGVAVFFLLLALGALSNYFHQDPNNPTIRKWASLVDNAKPVQASLDPTYRGHVLKMRSVAIDTTFVLTYRYVVAGQLYSGEYSVNKAPTSLDLPVFYDATDPAVSDPDPKKALVAAKAKATSRASLYFAIFLFLAAIGNFVRFREGRKKEKAEEAAQDERLRREREAFMAS